MEKKIIQYKGYEIIESCGYFYPAVNTNVECKTLKEAKKYLKDFWIPMWKSIPSDIKKAISFLRSINMVKTMELA